MNESERFDQFIQTINTDSIATLGACPHCGVAISKTHLIIEYETTDGPDIYAECPVVLMS